MWDFLDKWLFGVDQEEDIESFLKKYPNIDIRIIIAKVRMFNDIVLSKVNLFSNINQNLELENLDRYFLVVDVNLKEELKKALFWTNFLHRYRFYSIFPLAKYIKILSNDMIKVSMKYYSFRFKRRRYYFSYDLVFKRFDDDWAILETNIVSQLYWRSFKWILSVGFMIILVIVVPVADKNKKQKKFVKLQHQTILEKL